MHANCITETAPAKLNLHLAIGPLQPDGYHTLDSIMVPLDLHDTLVLTRLPAGSGVAIAVSGPAATGVPADHANLVYKAAHALAKSAGVSPDVHITLDKHIPAAGGLGGGSSDAAATLRALNRLWDLGCTESDLSALAARLGSDVPFCVIGRPSRVSGRGEVVTPLDLPLPDLWIVLILPGLAVSTAEVYRRLDAMRQSANRAAAVRKHRVAGIELFNELEDAALDVSPRLKEEFRLLDSLGVPGLMVAGSGSTLFAAFNSSEDANHWAQRIETHARAAVAVRRVVSGRATAT